jgi:hypothetical protein
MKQVEAEVKAERNLNLNLSLSSESGEPRWDRTNDHLIKSQVLYRLS